MERVVIVPPPILRDKFNNSNLPSMPGLKKCFLRNDHLKEPEKKGEPWCTHAQMIRFIDGNNQWWYEGHQYLRPDGTIGASGRLDPKRIRLDGVIYAVPPKE
jgi:hypothetical protein